MKACCVLVGLGQRQQFCFPIQMSQERQAHRRSRPTRLEIAVLIQLGMRRIVSTEAVGQDQRRVAGQFRH